MVQILTLIPVVVIMAVSLVHVAGSAATADRLGMVVLPVLGINMVAISLQSVALGPWLATLVASITAVGVAGYIRGHEHGICIADHLTFHHEVLRDSHDDDDPVFELLSTDHHADVEDAVSDLRGLAWQYRRHALAVVVVMTAVAVWAMALNSVVGVLAALPVVLVMAWWWSEGYGVVREVRAQTPEVAAMALVPPLWKRRRVQP